MLFTDFIHKTRVYYFYKFQSSHSLSRNESNEILEYFNFEFVFGEHLFCLTDGIKTLKIGLALIFKLITLKGFQKEPLKIEMIFIL